MQQQSYGKGGWTGNDEVNTQILPGAPTVNTANKAQQIGTDFTDSHYVAKYHGSSITPENRGYIKVNQGSLYSQSLIKPSGTPLSLNGCAMGCDKNPNCKSFQWAQRTNNATVKYGACWFRTTTTPTAGGTANSTAVTYNKPTVSPSKPTGLVLTGPMKNPAIDAGNNYYPACQVYGTSNLYEGHVIPYFRGFPGDFDSIILSTNQGNAQNHGCPYGNGRTSVVGPLYVDPSACMLPGEVYTTDYVNLGNGLDNGGNQVGDGSIGYKCTYSNLDSAWVFSNWTNLASYLNSQTDIINAQYRACSTLSANDLMNRDQSSNGYMCYQLANQTGTLKQYYNLVAQNSSNVLDKPGNFEALANACDTKAHPGNSADSLVCAEALNTIPSDNWNSLIIGGINSFNTAAEGVGNYTSDEMTAIKNRIEAYCSKPNSNSNPYCGCYNVLHYGVEGCKSTITGCDATVMALQSKVNAAGAQSLYQNLDKAQRASAHACNVTDNSVAIYGPEISIDVQFAACNSAISASGSTISGGVSQVCNIGLGGTGGSPPAGGTGGSPPAGGTGGSPPAGGSSSSSIPTPPQSPGPLSNLTQTQEIGIGVGVSLLVFLSMASVGAAVVMKK